MEVSVLVGSVRAARAWNIQFAHPHVAAMSPLAGEQLKAIRPAICGFLTRRGPCVDRQSDG
jgi:hypothetical protein